MKLESKETESYKLRRLERKHSKVRRLDSNHLKQAGCFSVISNRMTQRRTINSRQETLSGKQSLAVFSGEL